MRKFLVLFALITGLSNVVFSQKSVVTGTVKDQNGGPVIGATVQARGSNVAVVSDETGAFSINAPEGTKVLDISSVGYQPLNFPVSGGTVTAVLKKDESKLSEVVVVGYGQSAKKSVTGAISRISAKEVENQPVQSFESAMQGKSAGVVIDNSSGKVGQGIKVRIRGTSSINASSQPLYVVDGVPLTSESQSDETNEPTNPLIDLNPNDIESIDVLKDAAAAAIYGARASNGVVLITTKKGTRNDKTVVELNTVFGSSNPTKKRKFLDAKQYVQAIRTAALNDAHYDFTNDQDAGPFDTEQDAIDYYNDFYNGVLDELSLGTDYENAEVNSNWEDAQFRKNAMSSQIDLSVRGGNARTRFYVSGFYNDQEAIVVVNRFKRYGGRLNLEHNLTDKVTVGMNLTVTRSQLDRVTNDNAFSTPGQLAAQVPISPFRDPETGELNENTLYPSGLFDAQYNNDNQVTFRTVGNLFANYNIIPSLSFRSEFGSDVLNMTEQTFADKRTQDGQGIGKGQNITSQNVSFNTNNYFTYTPKISDDINLSVLLGMSYLQNDLVTSNIQAEEYPSAAVKNLSGATNVTFASSGNSRYTFLSYFLRPTFSFKDKYLLSFSIRADGSSRFGPANRYGYFPAVSAGWVLSEEEFMKNSNVISSLKLRASYGQTGNAEIGANQFYDRFSVSNYPSLPGYIPRILGDSTLKWEKTSQADIGLEFGLFNNRLTGEIDVYNKQTKDLLLAVNVPSTNGYFDDPSISNIIFRNLGKMTNKGLEISLTGRIFDQTAFKWTSSFNIAFNKNKVGDLNGEIVDGEQGSISRAVEGEPIGVFYMRKFVGVNPETGEAQYQGEDGKPTEDYNAAPRVVVGDPNPDFTGGWTNTFSYKGIDLNVFFTFVQGADIFNSGGNYMTAGFAGGFDNQTIDLLNAWSKPGDITNVPRTGWNYGSGARTASRWLYDGSYIRLRQLTLGYNLPQQIANSLRIKGARLFVSGLNLWLKTDYNGDPEVNTQGVGGSTVPNIASNIDFYTIPQPKTLSIGLNLRF